MRILVVDDNRSSADALVRALTKRGDTAAALYDGASAIAALREAPPDLVLTDLYMEPVDGMEVLRAARALRPPREVIVFTAYGEVGVAVEAMHLGARDFLTKPITLDQLLRRVDDVRRTLEPPALAPEGDPDAEPGSLDTAPGGPERPPGPAGASDPPAPFAASSPASRALLDTLERIADVPTPVWLEGEIGAGRGHAAATLHALGRPGRPFVTWDPSRPVPLPSDGTVLFPNVDDLAPDLQRALVRQLQELPSGARPVATAGPDALHKVHEGTLSRELYYALAVLVVPVPPLRDRPEDVVPLLEDALARFGATYGRPPPRLEPSHADLLLAHAWPGNIRELLNLAERAVVLGPEALRLEVVRRASPGLPRLEPGFSLSDYMESIERRILVEAMRRAGGDRNAAGKLLNVERNTLRYKLNKYGLL